MKPGGASALATLRRPRRRRIAGAVAGLVAALASRGAFGQEIAPAGSLRETTARHVEALPSSALVAEASKCGPGSTTTCCKAGCRDATPAREDACGRALGVPLKIGLGVAAGATGAGLGFGLGRGANGASLAREFQPFGLTDSLITAGSAAVAFVGYKAVSREPPELCRGGSAQCTGTEDSLRGIDAYVRKHWAWPSLRGRAKADRLGYLTLYATLALPPAFLLGAHDQPAQMREFGLTVESAAITLGILQIVKHQVNRPRPYAHYCEPGCGQDLGDRKAQLSFFSGHTALAFTVAVSAGTMASMRSYPNAGWVLGSGLTMAAATGYLRIAADWHYFTDVLTGALVGSAVGFAVPHLHGMQDRAPTDPSVSARRAPSRPSLVLPIPLRGPQGGLWLHGGIGADGPGVALSWTF